MKTFDTDVFTEILLGNPRLVQRADEIPRAEQFVPVVVLEEIIRGRLNAIRQADCRDLYRELRNVISRNRRDFERVPGLSIEFWD